MAFPQSVPIIKHDTAITLKVTGARDEEGGSGIKSYSIYYAIVTSGIEPNINDAQQLTTIEHLTQIPSTLDPAGETTSGYPSWNANETPSGIIRNHYHWDHVFNYDWYDWQSGMYHYFWCLAEDFAGNTTILESGIHPANPFFPGLDEQVITPKNLQYSISATRNVFLHSGGDLHVGLWNWDGGNTIYVPLNTQILAAKSDGTGICTKSLITGNRTINPTGGEPQLIYVTVSGWQENESNIDINITAIGNIGNLTENNLIIGTLDKIGGPSAIGAISMYHGGKSKWLHKSSTMFQLDYDTHTQYLLTAGSRTMAGNLNLGGYDVINVDEINGITISGLYFPLYSEVSKSLTTVPTAIDAIEYTIYCGSGSVNKGARLYLAYWHCQEYKKVVLSCQAKVLLNSHGGGKIYLDIGALAETNVSVTNTTYENKELEINVSSLSEGYHLLTISIEATGPASPNGGDTTYMIRPQIRAELV